MKLRLALCFALSICVLAASGKAAEVLPKGSRDDGVILSINGELVGGDASKLEAQYTQAISLGLKVSAVSLDTPGGLVVTGASMARFVRSKQLKSMVEDGAICASACFMIFAAGKEKLAGQNAKIGVHSANNPLLGESDDAKSTTIDMVRFLSELGVPPLVLGKLVTAKPNQMAWLTQEDLRLMRATPTRVAPPPRESYVETVTPPTPRVTAAPSSSDRAESRRLMVQGHSHMRARQYDQASALFASARKLSPYDADIATSFAEALFYSGKYQDAKQAITLAVQVKPDFSDTHRVLGMIAAVTGDNDWAKQSLVKYYQLSKQPDVAKSELERMRVTVEMPAQVKDVVRTVLQNI